MREYIAREGFRRGFRWRAGVLCVILALWGCQHVTNQQYPAVMCRLDAHQPTVLMVIFY